MRISRENKHNHSDKFMSSRHTCTLQLHVHNSFIIEITTDICMLWKVEKIKFCMILRLFTKASCNIPVILGKMLANPEQRCMTNTFHQMNPLAVLPREETAKNLQPSPKRQPKNITLPVVHLLFVSVLHVC